MHYPLTTLSFIGLFFPFYQCLDDKDPSSRRPQWLFVKVVGRSHKLNSSEVGILHNSTYVGTGGRGLDALYHVN